MLSHTWALMLVMAFRTCALGSHGRTQEVSNLLFCLLVDPSTDCPRNPKGLPSLVSLSILVKDPVILSAWSAVV